ncbi:hypothetical protein [Psychrosphaera aestuarii]|uniref:hypothetical protein n=1 Tax=Psychrosphaera aestuarii TaxID=1266052 RepID=UPI001B32187C|nr:hypothetical protein [Psychrosphaera aestuarii]
MESKTFPIVSTQANANSNSSTSQQASVLFTYLVQHLQSKSNQTTQQAFVIPSDLKASLSQWLSLKPQPNVDTMPAAIKNWLVTSLNKFQNQQGLTTLTASQWLPLISKMQLLSGTINNANHTVPDALRLSWLIGSSSLASKSSAIQQSGQAMIGGLLKLLIPIAMQDKASLIIRELPGSDTSRNAQSEQTSVNPLHQEDKHAKQQKVSEKQHEQQSNNKVQHGISQTLRFTLTFDLDQQGILSIDVDLNELNLTSVCHCSHPSLVTSVDKHWPLLASRLEMFGFKIENSVQLDEQLTETQNSSSHRLIDIKV